MSALKLTRIGNSVGVILPKELLARLKVDKGDLLHVTDSPYGIRLTPHDPYGKAEIASIAASCAVGLAKNHPLVDGNKRTAFVALELCLALNGSELTAGDVECTLTMLGVAAGDIDEAALAEWIRRHASPA